MTNKLNVKYEHDWNLPTFIYKNYGFTLTIEQGKKAFAQWFWCINNLK